MAKMVRHAERVSYFGARAPLWLLRIALTACFGWAYSGWHDDCNAVPALTFFLASFEESI
jgi:hypothetical protein